MAVITLTHVLQEAYKKLGQYNVTTATGGSTTTAADTKLVGRYNDDTWGGTVGKPDGTVIVVYDAGGAGGVPEGQFSRVSDYVDSTGVFTLRTTITAIAAGDRFAYMGSDYPLDDMIEYTNSALQALGDIALVDTTTLDTATSQTEYTYAVVWKRSPPYRVDYQGRTGDANDNRWVEIQQWEYIPATAGSTGLLVFPFQYVTGRDIRVWYRDKHPYVQAYNDPIHEGINPELITWAVVVEALEAKNASNRGQDSDILARLNKAEFKLAAAKADYPIWKLPAKSKLLTLGRRVALDQFTYPDPP